MIFNGVIALIMRFPLNSIALLANYVTMVEERPLMSAKYRLTVPVFHFWPKLTERGLSAIAELYLFVIRTCSRYFLSAKSYVYIDCSCRLYVYGCVCIVGARCRLHASIAFISVEADEKLGRLSVLPCRCCRWLSTVASPYPSSDGSVD